MHIATQNLLTALLELDDVERAELLQELLRSLEPKERSAIEAAWVSEAQKRFKAFDKRNHAGSDSREFIAGLLRVRV